MHFAHVIEFRTLFLIHFGWTKPDTEELQINLCFGFADTPAQSARRKQRGIAILDLNSQQWQRNSTVSEHYEPDASSLRCSSAMGFVCLSPGPEVHGSQLTVLFSVFFNACFNCAAGTHMSLNYALVARVPMVPGACGGFCTTTLGTVFLDKGVHFRKACFSSISRW
jgi:hypothetical protein